jgi:hypothetical protein
MLQHSLESKCDHDFLDCKMGVGLRLRCWSLGAGSQCLTNLSADDADERKLGLQYAAFDGVPSIARDAR